MLQAKEHPRSWEKRMPCPHDPVYRLLPWVQWVQWVGLGQPDSITLLALCPKVTQNVGESSKSLTIWPDMPQLTYMRTSSVLLKILVIVSPDKRGQNEAAQKLESRMWNSGYQLLSHRETRRLVCLSVYSNVGHGAHVYHSEAVDTRGPLVFLSFHHVSPEDWTQANRLGRQQVP